MRCEYCNKIIKQGDLAHGVKHGTTDHHQELFLPARDSAWTVICDQCAEMLCKLIYAKFRNTVNPTLYKTLTQIR